MKAIQRYAVAAAAVLAVIAGRAHAATAQEGVDATAQAFSAALDAGDIEAALKTQAPNAGIVDDFAPYHWSGPEALRAWWKDFGAFIQANNVTEPSVKFVGTPRIEVTGDNAYAMYPSVFTFKAAGKPMKAQGAVVMALVRIGQEWKIAGWGWGGERPH